MLATLATWGRDAEIPVVVVSGDRDTFQLVEDPFVKVLYNRRGRVGLLALRRGGHLRALRHRARALPAARRPARRHVGQPARRARAWGRRPRRSSSRSTATSTTSTPTSTTLTPKLRENLAAYEERARNNETRHAPRARRAPRLHARRPHPRGLAPRRGRRLLRALRDELDAHALRQADAATGSLGEPARRRRLGAGPRRTGARPRARRRASPRRARSWSTAATRSWPSTPIARPCSTRAAGAVAVVDLDGVPRRRRARSASPATT